VTTTIYMDIQAVALGILGPALADYASAPLAEAMARVVGPGGRLFVLAGATVSTFGYVAGDMLGTPRALFALARDRMLPSALARVHPRFHTPHAAILAYATVVAAAAITSTFAELAIVANVAILTLYLLCVLASYELQRRDVRSDGAPFILPGGIAVPLLAAALIVWLVSQATIRELTVEAVVLTCAALAYYGRRARLQSL
jgi:amino acid transporter